MIEATATISEVWRPVPGYEGLYSASSEGRIRNDSTGRIKSQRTHKGAWGEYLRVDLWKDNERGSFLVQRIILSAFKGLPTEDGLVGRHLDGNSLNNRIENLEWGTASQNRMDYLERRDGNVSEKVPMDNKHGAFCYRTPTERR